MDRNVIKICHWGASDQMSSPTSLVESQLFVVLHVKSFHILYLVSFLFAFFSLHLSLVTTILWSPDNWKRQMFPILNLHHMSVAL